MKVLVFDLDNTLCKLAKPVLDEDVNILKELEKKAKAAAKLEKEIVSPIFYKTNGNFNLGNGKIKNGNIYFCEAGIVCVCLEENNEFQSLFSSFLY